MDPGPTRRRLLAGVACGALAGASGCPRAFSGDEDETEGSEPVSAAPTAGDGGETESPAASFTAVAASRSPAATFAPGRSASFGRSVATTGDVVFVGLPHAAPDGRERAGAVAVFERSTGGWERAATLTGRRIRGQFGRRVVADGSTLLVGNDYPSSGTPRLPVSVFERAGDGWRRTADLVDRVHVESMALADGTAVLRTADGDGLAAVFERRRGEWERRRTPSVDRRDDGRRVRAVATDGETALVGAVPRAGPERRRADSGVVFVFERADGAWRRRTTLSGGTGTDHFGWSVAVEEGTALVGDYAGDTASLFGRSEGGWSREGTYTATDGESHRYFGETVALDGARRGAVRPGRRLGRGGVRTGPRLGDGPPAGRLPHGARRVRGVRGPDGERGRDDGRRREALRDRVRPRLRAVTATASRPAGGVDAEVPPNGHDRAKRIIIRVVQSAGRPLPDRVSDRCAPTRVTASRGALLWFWPLH